ncbi:hypothetical protein BGZ83_011114 [Gryganskiella cystojenkinii]|nr:hypothetical protein BGZ83_011114 [Gryganskiella cystojenkinii]
MSLTAPNKPNTGAIVVSPRTTPQPLLVPELLEQILSYLKESTLRFVVSLVCRDWSAAARYFIHRTVYWNADQVFNQGKGQQQQRQQQQQHQDQDQESWNRQLECAQTLVCRQTKPEVYITREQSLEFNSAIETTDPGGTKAQERASALVSKLKELTRNFNSDSGNNNRNNLRTLILYMSAGTRLTVTQWAERIIEAAGPTLTSLEIHDIWSRIPFSVYSIQRHCPRLRSLVMKGRFVMGPAISAHLMEQPIAAVEAEADNTQQQEHIPSPSSPAWGLQSCVLHTLILNEKPLEDLARLCPRLRRLIIIRSQPKRFNSLGRELVLPTEDPGSTILHQPDWIRDAFLIRLARLLPDLETFHISLNKRYSARSGFSNRVLDIFPNIKSWGVGLWDLRERDEPSQSTVPPSPSPLPLMDRFRIHLIENRLTTLDILENMLHLSFEKRVELQARFHQFLCQSPQLIHLRASGAPFLVTNLDPDLFMSNTSRGDTTTTTASIDNGNNNIIPVLWACRNLKTLHIAFVMIRYTDPRNWRLVFGYIARVCPRLQELWLSMRYTNISLLDGFCLLSRIKTLKRLQIGVPVAADAAGVSIMDSTGVADLDWMDIRGQHDHLSLQQPLDQKNPRGGYSGNSDVGRIITGRTSGSGAILTMGEHLLAQSRQTTSGSEHPPDDNDGPSNGSGGPVSATTMAFNSWRSRRRGRRSVFASVSRLFQKSKVTMEPSSESTSSDSTYGNRSATVVTEGGVVDAETDLVPNALASTLIKEKRAEQEDDDEDEDEDEDEDLESQQPRVIVEGVDITDLGNTSDLEQYFLERRNESEDEASMGVWPDLEHIRIREWQNVHSEEQMVSRRKRLFGLLTSARPDIVVEIVSVHFLNEVF